MATYYLVGSIRVGTQVLYAGALIDDAVVDTTALIAAGALLWPSSDAVIAAAALKAQQARLNGQNETICDRIMRDAVDSVQKSSDAADIDAVDLASTNPAKGAALVGWDGGTTVKAALDAGMTASKKTVTVGQADLTDAVNGEAQAINIGTTLPANARIVGRQLKLATPFTGGGAASVSLDIGTAGDPDAIVAGADVFAAAVDGQASTNPNGIAPNKHFVAAGAQLIATFKPDGGATLLALTAGSIVIDVEYIVLA